MSAGKLSRFTGLVFVLAAFLGGSGAYGMGVAHGAGGATMAAGGAFAEPAGAGVITMPADYEWN